MPILEGETLDVWHKRKSPVRPAELAGFLSKVCHALQAAHEAGVIHRDLKPTNIMVQAKDEPVVMDFGLARRHGPRDARVTSSGAIIGTPAYSAPEQFGGDANAITPAADVYSLGVILYEMLAGRLPFQGTFHEVWKQFLTQDADPPSHDGLGIDPRLEVICMKAMSKEVTGRYASMAELAHALEEYVNQTNSAPFIPGRSPGHPLGGIARGSNNFAAGRLSRRWHAWVAIGLVTTAAIPLLIFLLGGHVRKDSIQAGSTWSGSFHFLPPHQDYGGDVVLHITSRSGSDFTGVYETEKGIYSWVVAGTISDGKIQWQFTDAIRDNEPKNVVGLATVDGTYADKLMEVRFENSFNKEIWMADIRLKLQE